MLTSSDSKLYLMQKLIEKFKDVKVLVYGDVMLDQYWWGTVDRISPEAPVPVINLERKSLVLGGAANVAANITSLSAKTILFGAIGNDQEGKDLPKILKSVNISADNLFTFENRKTTTKTRIIGHNQQIARIDQETINKLSENEEEIVFQRLEEQIKNCDIILISDYAKGFVTDFQVMRLITLANKNKKIILVDPKGKNYSKYKFSSVLTPNHKEALAATKFDSSDDKTIEAIGSKMLEELKLDALIITRGEKGMSLFQKGKDIQNLKASARKVYDVTGAGDTVIATLAVAIGAGATFVEAATLANIAAGLVVEEIGTTVIDLKKLKAELKNIEH